MDLSYCYITAKQVSSLFIATIIPSQMHPFQ